MAKREGACNEKLLLFIGFTHANTTFCKLNPTNTFVIKISGIGCANTQSILPLNESSSFGLPVPRATTRARAGLRDRNKGNKRN